MKKLTILFLCIATLGLASCKKDTIINQTTPNRTVVLNVASNAWTLSTNGLTYYTILNVPEIDQFSLDNEAVLVYISYDNGASYLQMPFVYDVDAYSTVISKGKVEIDIQSSDNQATTPIKPSVNVRVKIVLIAADNVT
ncbi:hypothetical protein EZ428_11210 [Pedobacter frigiditerrae]|uniref:DUF1735 domain-containing protein n=1 Tax=Pedobacter frigiditerrae TaxID=2530452 RepID=A0A4R0MZ95_9SPHI|nr:hypothetical protein [Pedobacter frigiditerrae]TCC92287.1 hypothetical protein EZ428_11210 [Pedobacter frigiditerrae]